MAARREDPTRRRGGRRPGGGDSAWTSISSTPADPTAATGTDGVDILGSSIREGLVDETWGDQIFLVTLTLRAAAASAGAVSVGLTLRQMASAGANPLGDWDSAAALFDRSIGSSITTAGDGSGVGSAE